MESKTMIAAAMGDCVHVAGINRFMNLAEQTGWKVIYLGPAVPVKEISRSARQHNADLVAVSYRLTPENGEKLFGELAEEMDDLFRAGVRFAFGGTPPLAEKAEKFPLFEKVFSGGEKPEITLSYLRGEVQGAGKNLIPPQKAIDRILWKQPYPIIRHHFGLPTMELSLEGIHQIAESGVLDVISLGIDQDAQENFFHPERQNPSSRGAGGVPVRSREDYENLYQASRKGNYPLMRTYSGTDDFIRLAEMYIETINNAWCAIPLFWFNQMDGRGPWDLEGSIIEHQNVMNWYGERDIPVELNEPHHWGMRDAPDVVFAVSAYLAAYNAKHFGVKNYIAQLMFNSPPDQSDANDLAKMAAILDLIHPLEDSNFKIWKQTRTGLLSYPVDEAEAMGHLASSVYLQMALKPHIVHVVGHSEAHHAATGADVITAAKIASRAIDNAIQGAPDLLADPKVQARKNEIIREAKITLKAITNLAKASQGDPFTNPKVLTKAVEVGIMDAPQLRNNPFARGKIHTRILQGACVAVGDDNKPIDETTRLKEWL